MRRVEAHADSRDMLALHNGFRREFGEMPAIVQGVDIDDRRRAAAVAKHAAFLFTVLHVHHTGEDQMVWPLLRERSPAELHLLLEKVESQHAAIDVLLRAARERVATWEDDPTKAKRQEATEALSAALPALHEHLDLEEREVVPLIDRHLSETEWWAVAAAGQRELSLLEGLMTIGMALTTATVEQRAVIRKGIPGSLYPLISRLGPWLYARQRSQVDNCTTHER